LEVAHILGELEALLAHKAHDRGFVDDPAGEVGSENAGRLDGCHLDLALGLHPQGIRNSGTGDAAKIDARLHRRYSSKTRVGVQLRRASTKVSIVRSISLLRKSFSDSRSE